MFTLNAINLEMFSVLSDRMRHGKTFRCLCEQLFSEMEVVKSKSRNRLDDEIWRVNVCHSMRMFGALATKTLHNSVHKALSTFK
jgi:hypothetical protein